MKFKKIFWINVILATFFILSAPLAFKDAPSGSKIFQSLFMDFMALAPIFTAIEIKRNKANKLNIIAMLLNYINIPVFFLYLAQNIIIRPFLFIAIPTSLNLIALRVLKNPKANNLEDYKQSFLSFIKSNFR